MTQIRIDPEVLNQSSTRLSYISTDLNRIGGDLRCILENTPSYDGQFKPGIQAMGWQAQSRSLSLTQKFNSLSASLKSRADAFLKADQAVAGRLATSSPFISDDLFIALSLLSAKSGIPIFLISRLIHYGGISNLEKYLSRNVFIWQQDFPFGIKGSSKLGFLGKEKNIWPERRGRPKDNRQEAELHIPVWKDKAWSDSVKGNTKVGGLRLGYKDSLEALIADAEVGLGIKEKAGPFAGLFLSATAFKVGLSGVAGDKNLGLGLGFEAKAFEGEVFAGYKDGNVGAKIGGTIVSEELTGGVNVLGSNVGLSGEIGLKFELGVKVGTKTRVYLGPFTVGLNISEALGS